MSRRGAYPPVDDQHARSRSERQRVVMENGFVRGLLTMLEAVPPDDLPVAVETLGQRLVVFLNEVPTSEPVVGPPAFRTRRIPEGWSVLPGGKGATL